MLAPVHDLPSPAPRARLAAPTQALQRRFVLAADAPARTRDARTEMLQRQGFLVGPLRLMVRYEDGRELTDMPPLYRLPGSPAWLLGVANLHGGLVPVLDLAPLAGVEHLDAPKPMLLVLGHGSESAALVIDGLPQRLRIAPEQRLTQVAIPSGLNDCIDEAYRNNELDWMEFRYRTLFERLEAQLAH
jgi:twitching motility protein PilI